LGAFCAGLRLDQERLSRVTHLAVQVDLCLQQVADKPALGRIDSEYPTKPGYRQHRSNCLAYEMQPEAERHRNYSCSSQYLHGPKPQPKKTVNKKAKATTPIKAAQKTAAKKTTAKENVAA
jgi:hypothetical protein